MLRSFHSDFTRWDFDNNATAQGGKESENEISHQGKGNEYSASGTMKVYLFGNEYQQFTN